MPIQKTLLERIRSPLPPGQRHMYVSSTEVFNSVLNNLQNLLNTVQGNCLTDDRYGLPHLSEVRGTMPHSVARFEAAIRQTIERHEPRLTAVRVRHAPDDRGGVLLRFEISGLIQDEDGRHTVRFETYADDQGRLKIR